jgi:amino acid transporter
VPYNSPLLLSANSESGKTVSANASPFVVAANIAGVSFVPDIINGCLLIFTFSAANTDLYIATRSLYSLAVEGNAPSLFARTSDRGVPLYALGVCSSFALIAFISVDIGSFETFRYFVSLVTIFGLLTWISILLSHIYFVRARRAQVIPDTALAYVSPFGIQGSFCALIFAFIILLFNGFADFTPDPVTGERFQWRKFIVNYIGVIIFGAMIAGYKVVVKTKVWSAQQADIFEGKQKIDDDEAEFLAAEAIRLRDCPESKWTKWYRATLGNFF